MWPFRKKQPAEQYSTDTELNQRRREFEFSAIDIEEHARRQSVRAEAMASDNQRLGLLFGIVRHLNEIQDEDVQVIDRGFESETITRKTRCLNGHEEDLLNASLIQMKDLLDFE